MGALSAAAAWHAACPLQNRCGGVYAATPLGLSLGPGTTRVPVAVILAACAAALAVWVWRGLNRPPADAAIRALAAGAAFLAVLSLSRPLQLRLSAWPAAGDIPLAVAAGGYAVAAAAQWRRSRSGPTAERTARADDTPAKPPSPQVDRAGADGGAVARWKTTIR